MEFQRARTKKQIENRQNEIINACAELYREMPYDSITLKAISEKVSISRTSLYSYYKTKEEVFLDLMKREYLDWENELRCSFSRADSMNRKEFCMTITNSLLHREVLIKILSIHLTTIENNCSITQLSRFKLETKIIFDTLADGIYKTFNVRDAERINFFEIQLFIFIFGIYPFTHPTKLQIEAMEMAGLPTPVVRFEELCYEGVYNLTAYFL